MLHLIFGCAQYQESANARSALAVLRTKLSGVKYFQNDLSFIEGNNDSWFLLKAAVDRLFSYQCLTPDVLHRLCHLYSVSLDVTQFKTLARFSGFLDRLNALDLGSSNYLLLQSSIFLSVLNDNFFIIFPDLVKVIACDGAKQLFSDVDGFQRFEYLLQHPNVVEALHVMAIVMPFVPLLLVKYHPSDLFKSILSPEWKVIALKEFFDVLEPHIITPYDKVLLLGHSTQLLEMFIHLQLPDSSNPLKEMRKIICFIPYLPCMTNSSPLSHKLSTLQGFLACTKVWLTSMAYTFFFEEGVDYDNTIRNGVSCEALRPHLANEHFYDQLITAACHPIQAVSWFGEMPPQPNTAVSTLLIQLSKVVANKSMQWGRLPRPDEILLNQVAERNDRPPRYAPAFL